MTARNNDPIEQGPSQLMETVKGLVTSCL